MCDSEPLSVDWEHGDWYFIRIHEFQDIVPELGMVGL